jgi:malonyl-CoA O-methyltransferase
MEFMRVSLRTDQAKIALDFIKELELASGGVRGWGGSPAYPEVSGYLIPTLLDYGEREFAHRLADWLVIIQNNDGSYCDMHGQKRSFDTAAVMEGLQAIGNVLDVPVYKDAALLAKEWLTGLGFCIDWESFRR